MTDARRAVACQAGVACTALLAGRSHRMQGPATDRWEHCPCSLVACEGSATSVGFVVVACGYWAAPRANQLDWGRRHRFHYLGWALARSDMPASTSLEH